MLCDSIVEWNLVFKKELSPKDLRIEYIVGHGVFIEAIGLVGNYLRNFHADNWNNILRILEKLIGIEVIQRLAWSCI